MNTLANFILTRFEGGHLKKKLKIQVHGHFLNSDIVNFKK
jgi:hypothetical protein